MEDNVINGKAKVIVNTLCIVQIEKTNVCNVGITGGSGGEERKGEDKKHLCLCQDSRRQLWGARGETSQ